MSSISAWLKWAANGLKWAANRLQCEAIPWHCTIAGQVRSSRVHKLCAQMNVGQGAFPHFTSLQKDHQLQKRRNFDTKALQTTHVTQKVPL